MKDFINKLIYIISKNVSLKIIILYYILSNYFLLMKNLMDFREISKSESNLESIFQRC